MAGRSSDRDVTEAIAFVLRTPAGTRVTAPAPLARFRADLVAACGRDVPADSIRNCALDVLRHLTAASRADRERCFVAMTRCDVRGEAHTVVAADLGVSRSQFYRDLQHARLAVGRAVEEAARRRTPANPIYSFDMSVATVRALHSCGRTSDAIAAAAELAARESGANSILARCLAVELLAEDCRILEAERERAKIPRVPVGNGGRFAQAGVMLLVADAAIALGRLDTDMVDRARVALAAAVRLADRQGRAEAEAIATALLARALMERGELAAGHALLAAYERKTSGARIRPSLRAALIAARSGLYQFEPWALGESYEQTRRLLECAVVNELPRPGIDALTGFASLLCKQDNLSVAEPYARAALANARRAGSSEQVATALGTMSILLSESGRPAEGLNAAEDMSRQIGGEGVWAVQGALLRSLALLRLKRADEAIAACESLATEATCRSDGSALGVTKRIMAEAFVLRGARGKALTEIDESVSLLESVGRPYMLLRSYAVSHRLSGNGRHGALARSLQSALRGFDARPYLPE